MLFFILAFNAFAFISLEFFEKNTITEKKQEQPQEKIADSSENRSKTQVNIFNLESELSLDQANQIRERIVPQISLAANNTHLLEVTTMSLEEAFDCFNKNKGGVWCGGAAHILTKTYLAQGFPAITLSYGFLQEGLLTHAVTVVKTKDGWFIQDPYFNLYFTDPFPKLISKLLKGEVPTFIATDAHRTVHFEEIQIDPLLLCYKSDKRESKIFKIDDNHFIGTFSLDLDLFVLNYYKIKKTFASLKCKNIPENICFLLLYPYYVFDGKQGFVIKDYSDVSYLFDQ